MQMLSLYVNEVNPSALATVRAEMMSVCVAVWDLMGRQTFTWRRCGVHAEWAGGRGELLSQSAGCVA